jgi:hypothetical protein
MVLGRPVLGLAERSRRPRPRQVRRIRDDARDGISVAALSFTASLAATVMLWALMRWLS